MISIDGIRWNRSLFELNCSSDKEVHLALCGERSNRHISFESEQAGDYWIARLNIVIAGKREVLSDDSWMICEAVEESSLGEGNSKSSEKKISYRTDSIIYSEEILDNLINYSAVFRYAKNSYAYTISLVAKPGSDGSVCLALEPEFFKRNPNPKVRVWGKAFYLKQIMKLIFSFFSILSRPSRDGRTILFLKENGAGPTDNMKALHQRMRERGLENEFRIISSYRNVFSGRQSVSGWLKDLFLIAKADYIFIDDYTPVFNFITPNPDTQLVQIWHAGVGFKSVGYARFGISGSPDPYASCHREYTFALVGNEGLRDIYSEVFGIEKEALLATGMPRLDHFLDSAKAERIRRDILLRYPFLQQGRVILFAPTYRGQNQREAYYPYECFDMQRLYDMCERTNSFFLFEMHHFISKKPVIESRYSDRIFDFSHESINDLFYVTDVLVTDYSSCFYDFLLLEKPVVFFTPDREVYTAIRGVQRPIADMAPGLVCDSFTAFVDALESGRYEAKIPDSSMIDRAREGGMLASDRAIDTILFKKEIPGVKLKNG